MRVLLSLNLNQWFRLPLAAQAGRFHVTIGMRGRC